MLPAIVSQLVVIVKDTALGGAVLSFPELLASVRPMSANYGSNTIACFTIVALVYLALNFALTSFASWLERRLRRGKKSTGEVVGTGPGASWRRSVRRRSRRTTEAPSDGPSHDAREGRWHSCHRPSPRSGVA